MRVRDTWDTIDKYGILVGAIFFFFSFLSLFFFLLRLTGNEWDTMLDVGYPTYLQ